MIERPDHVLAPEHRLEAYASLIAALAAHEPEALERIAAALEESGGPPPPDGTAPPAAVLARGWLAFNGYTRPESPPAGASRYSFSYAAVVSFDLTSNAGERAAKRLARQEVAALLATDTPLCAMRGSLPGHPAVQNVEIWIGSAGEKGDVLTLENVDSGPTE